MNRRRLLRQMLGFFVVASSGFARKIFGQGVPENYDPEAFEYGMAIDVDKCIGCTRCMEACETENDVPKGPHYVRTWIERYRLMEDGEPIVTNINVDEQSDGGRADEGRSLQSFYVPKLCNHCTNPPCVQVCPVGATFTTRDGVILVDSERCIGCRYCIQACPYGARYLHPETHTADKCTFCYHRLVRGLLPACVEVCPTQARVFGNEKSHASPLSRFRRMKKIHVLKPYLNTEPRVIYTNIDGVVS